MRYFIKLIFSLLTVAAMIWAIWQGYLLLNQQQLGLLPSQRSAVIIGAILMLILTFALSMSIGSLGDKNLKAQQFIARYDLYKAILSAYSQAPDDLPANQSSKLNITNLEQQLLLLSTEKVLKAFNNLQRSAVNDGTGSTLNKDVYKKLIIAMREDLDQPTDYLVRTELQNLLK